MDEEKYTWEDLIFNPTTDESKSAIGKEVYYSDKPSYCIDYANENNKEFLGVLDRTEKSNNPFYIKESINWACIIVKKEEPKKYVPFETLDEFIESYKKAEERIAYSNTRDYIASCGMWLRFNNDDVLCAVTEIWTDGVFLGHDHMKIKWEELFNFYTFMDDSPCGKLMEVEDL